MGLVTLTFDLPSKFGHARPLGSRIICYVRDGRTDRQTDRRTKATLIVPFSTGGGIIRDVLCVLVAYVHDALLMVRGVILLYVSSLHLLLNCLIQCMSYAITSPPPGTKRPLVRTPTFFRCGRTEPSMKCFENPYVFCVSIVNVSNSTVRIRPEGLVLLYAA